MMSKSGPSALVADPACRNSMPPAVGDAAGGGLRRPLPERVIPAGDDVHGFESHEVVAGPVTVQVGEERIVATAGMFANMPVGTPHSFKNESSKPARILISVAPAGLEKMFFECGVPLPEGSTTALPPTKEEIEELLAVAPSYGIEIRLPGN